MSKKLFVGNIDWNTTEEELKESFSQFGAIEEAVIINDKISGRPRGFGFVTFTEDKDADAAISKMNGQELNGRNLVVNEARAPKPRNY